MSLLPLKVLRRPDNGPWRIEADGDRAAYIQFPQIRLTYQTEHGRVELRSPDAAQDPIDGMQRWCFENCGVRVDAKLRIDEQRNCLLIEAQVHNDSDASLRLQSLDLLHLDGDHGADLVLGESRNDWAVFQNGWQSWSASETLSMDDADTSPRIGLIRVQEEDYLNPGAAKPGRVRSDGVTAIVDRQSGCGLLLGFISGARQFGDMLLELGRPRLLLKRLRATLRFDGMLLEPGRSVRSETLMLGFFGPGAQPLELWAELCGERMAARVPKRKPVGWCSWYHYFRNIDEQEMRLNIERIAALRDRLPIEIIQLDDGYQDRLGDWLEINDKFPAGLDDLAQRIDQAGFTPGIWTAPFSCMRKSRVFREHPEWVLRDARGKPISGGINPMWGGRYYGLDMTHPGALEYVERCLGQMRQWGFRFFKIDFLFCACLDGVRHDPTSTRADALRRGLEAVRRAIGDGFLLGCGCPLLPAVGIVDCMRIGPDVTPLWDRPLVRRLLSDRHMLSANNALRNTITRAFMHRRLWFNDPDCLMIRRVDNKLSEDETRTLAAIIAASGGMLLVSDNMSKVDPDRLELAIAAAALQSENFLAVDLFARRRPELMLAQTPEGPLAVLANFEERSRELSFDVATQLGCSGRELCGRELFDGREVRAPGGVLRAKLEPHACLAVVFDR
ncbi:MAG: alpha-galactosidase [Candidatus Alcyoniella australis]|nr:alpha-galactosidase [Candidatus Alcyoniella australis]